MKRILFLIFIVILISGCIGGDGGIKTSQTDGVVFNDFSISPKSAESGEQVSLSIDFQNIGGKTAEETTFFVAGTPFNECMEEEQQGFCIVDSGNSEITDIEKPEWEIGSLLSPDKTIKLEGEEMNTLWLLGVPCLSLGLTSSYDITGRACYQYSTTALANIDVISVQEKLIEQQRGTYELKPIELDNSGGPIQLEIRTRQPLITYGEERSTRVAILAKNVGKGTVFDYEGSDCSKAIPDTSDLNKLKVVARIDGEEIDCDAGIIIISPTSKEGTINCNWDAEAVETRQQKHIEVTAVYGYYTDAKTSVQVTGSEPEACKYEGIGITPTKKKKVGTVTAGERFELTLEFKKEDGKPYTEGDIPFYITKDSSLGGEVAYPFGVSDGNGEAKITIITSNLPGDNEFKIRPVAGTTSFDIVEINVVGEEPKEPKGLVFVKEGEVFNSNFYNVYKTVAPQGEVELKAEITNKKEGKIEFSISGQPEGTKLKDAPTGTKKTEEIKDGVASVKLMAGSVIGDVTVTIKDESSEAEIKTTVKVTPSLSSNQILLKTGEDKKIILLDSKKGASEIITANFDGGQVDFTNIDCSPVKSVTGPSNVKICDCSVSLDTEEANYGIITSSCLVDFDEEKSAKIKEVTYYKNQADCITIHNQCISVVDSCKTQCTPEYDNLESTGNDVCCKGKDVPEVCEWLYYSQKNKENCANCYTTDKCDEEGTFFPYIQSIPDSIGGTAKLSIKLKPKISY